MSMLSFFYFVPVIVRASLTPDIEHGAPAGGEHSGVFPQAGFICRCPAAILSQQSETETESKSGSGVFKRREGTYLWCVRDASYTALTSCNAGNLPAFVRHFTEAHPLLVGTTQASESPPSSAPYFLCICTTLVVLQSILNALTHLITLLL